MTAVLKHTRWPALRIVNPETDVVSQFTATGDGEGAFGILVIQEDDPNYEVVMAYAKTDPAVSIEMTGLVECSCGERFNGPMAKANLTKHQKKTGHEGSSDIGVLAKSAATFSCEFDKQEFDSEDDLAEHMTEAHNPKPKPDDVVMEGSSVMQTGTSTTTNTIPAARPSGRS